MSLRSFVSVGWKSTQSRPSVDFPLEDRWKTQGNLRDAHCDACHTVSLTQSIGIRTQKYPLSSSRFWNTTGEREAIRNIPAVKHVTYSLYIGVLKVNFNHSRYHLHPFGRLLGEWNMLAVIACLIVSFFR